MPLATAGMMLAAAAAAALDPATGKIVLTVTGKIAARNTPDAAAFDMALLEQLPRQSFTTKTPWYPKPRKFTGVLLRDVLKAAGAAPGKINATALNDYRVEIPADDIANGDAMLAYLLDDQPMTVREKGPLVIIYPFDDKPELRTAVHFSRAIWQLRSLEVQ
ncbi:MAG TPA: molybdopterin-dependent oxidoreductase [Burkholderiaceae bacterium]|nr:molybdopterin-dependent oxidoreductase [Burkholderiaceae bacterium]